MKYALACLLLLLTAMPLAAQSEPNEPVQGSLYVLVDHSATLFINGVEVKIPKSKAAPKAIPVTLQPGDHIVVKLSSTHSKGEGSCMLLFVSSTRQTMISFRAVSFKILPDPEMTDFTPEQFAGFEHQAVPRHDLENKQTLFPYKNNCEGFWGDRDECAIGTLITRDMFSPILPQ